VQRLVLADHHTAPEAAPQGGDDPLGEVTLAVAVRRSIAWSGIVALRVQRQAQAIHGGLLIVAHRIIFLLDDQGLNPLEMGEISTRPDQD
jgi:hypothetical protein